MVGDRGAKLAILTPKTHILVKFTKFCYFRVNWVGFPKILVRARPTLPSPLFSHMFADALFSENT